MSLFFYSLSNSVLSPQNTSPRSRFFLILIHYFLCIPFGPREWFAVCGLVYWVYLFFSYHRHALLDFSETGTTFYLMHTLQVQHFSELSCYLIIIIPEQSLHSRVKGSITHNSSVIWSSNFNGRLIC